MQLICSGRHILHYCCFLAASAFAWAASTLLFCGIQLLTPELRRNPFYPLEIFSEHGLRREVKTSL